MIVTCPACATRYLVDPVALRATGRTVRCARCAATWHQDPPVDAPPPEPAASQPVTPPAMVGGGIPAEPQISINPPGDSSMERFRAQLPAIPEPRRRFSAVQLGWAGLILFLVLLIGGLALFHIQIIDAWPPARRLYAAINWAPPLPRAAYEIRHTNGSIDATDGHRAFIVTGAVANISQQVQPAPKMRLTLNVADGTIVKLYDFAIDHAPLQPDESVPFKYSATDVPPEAVPKPQLSVAAQ